LRIFFEWSITLPQIKSFLSAIIASSLILILMTACGQLAEMDSHSTVSRFQKSENLYRSSFRWGDWTTIFQLMKNKPAETDSTSEKTIDEKENYNVLKKKLSSTNDLNILDTPSEELLEHLDSIHVQEIIMLSSGMNDKEGSGKSRFEITYRTDSSVKIHSVKHTVHWWYHKDSNSWFTDTPLPKEFRPTKRKTIKLSPPGY